jgi:hypothetical protein
MTGAAYIFVRSGGSWVEDAKLTPSDGVAADLFGQSVAISGDTAVVGAFWHATNGFLAGAAYVYVRDPVGGGWTEEQKLLPPMVGPGDQFGWDVAIDGDTIAVGSPDHAHAGVAEGGAYVFVRSPGGVWAEEAYQSILPTAI